MLCHTVFTSILVIKVWLVCINSQNDVQKASFFNQKYLFLDYLLSLLNKEKQLQYLTDMIISSIRKDILYQSLVNNSCVPFSYW